MIELTDEYTIRGENFRDVRGQVEERVKEFLTGVRGVTYTVEILPDHVEDQTYFGVTPTRVDLRWNVTVHYKYARAEGNE